MNIVAVDPGTTCGVARFAATLHGPDFFQSWEAPRWDVLRDIEAIIRGGVGLIVCESFVPRPGVRSWQPDALETIGALRYICRRAGVTLETQAPADAKRFATNEKLAALGWRNPTPGGHTDDAARHLLLAAVRHGLIDPGRFAE